MYKIDNYNLYNLNLPSNKEFPTTSTMQRHIAQAHDGTLAAIVQRGNDSSIISTERGLVFLRSLDNGATWTLDHQLTGGAVYTVSMEIKNNSDIYVAYGGISDPGAFGAGADIAFRKFSYDSNTKTWYMGTQYIVLNNTPSVSHDNWVVLTREIVSGRLWTAWRNHVISTDIASIQLAYSDNEGVTWTNSGVSLNLIGMKEP